MFEKRDFNISNLIAFTDYKNIRNSNFIKVIRSKPYKFDVNKLFPSLDGVEIDLYVYEIKDFNTFKKIVKDKRRKLLRLKDSSKVWYLFQYSF